MPSERITGTYIMCYIGSTHYAGACTETVASRRM
jgi:hypothetical protein